MLILHNGWVLLESELAVLAEDFVTGFAFKRHVWEFFAHSAADFIDQFLLKFVLNLIKFNINCWNRLWTHDLLNCLLWDHEIIAPLTNVLCISLILLWNHSCYWDIILNWSSCHLLLLNVGSSWADVSHTHSYWGAVSSH